jgi:hypothetical protein
MSQFYPMEDRLTPIPESEFITTAIRAWNRFYGIGPDPEQVACCLSQIKWKNLGRRAAALNQFGSGVGGRYLAACNRAPFLLEEYKILDLE